jgi:phenylalanyl-tRNA synthetase beta chain
MLKWGQPLHAFDLDSLEGKVIVRRAKSKERLMCIDNKERELNAKALVIADSKKAVALAGVMGGRDTEVSNKTNKVFLEAAIFSPLQVRRTRRFLGINTDSSYRFERSVNPFYIDKASGEAAYLLQKICGAKIRGYKRVGNLKVSKQPWIKFESLKMNNFLGTDIKEGKALQILKNLGFQVIKKKKDVSVKPPVFRQDITLEQDLFEEVVRIWGYENIKEELPLLRKDMRIRPSLYDFKEKAREKAISLGFKEILTLSIVNQKNLSSYLLKEVEPIRVVNPLRAQEDILRPFVFLGMLERLKYNVYRRKRNLEFFEIADSFLKSGGSFEEKGRICLGAHSDSGDDFYLFKAKVEAFLKTLNITKLAIQEEDNRLFSNFCLIQDLGWMGILKAEKARGLDLNCVFLAEFDLKKLLSKASISIFEAINYLPWVERDISLAVSKKVKFKQIEELIKSKAGPIFKSLEVCDVYKGEKIPKGFTGFSLRIFYQHKTRTLEASEVDNLHFALRDSLSSIEGVTLR